MQNTESFDRPVFVLGPPRSGTSMVAGCLHIAGCWKGTTFEGNEDNPGGFFEHVSLREGVNKPLLKTLGCDPLGVRKLPAIADVPEIPPLYDAVREILEQDGYPGNRVWMFKDPKLSLLWPAWRSVFPAARWVIVNRETDDIVNSCLNTGFMAQHSSDLAFWENWIAEYNARLHALKKTSAQVYEIESGDLVRDQLSALENLVVKLDLKWHEDKINQFIRPEYWKRERGDLTAR